MENFLMGLGAGLLIGGGVVYYFYAKLKASIGAIETTAANVRKVV